MGHWYSEMSLYTPPHSRKFCGRNWGDQIASEQHPRSVDSVDCVQVEMHEGAEPSTANSALISALAQCAVSQRHAEAQQKGFRRFYALATLHGKI